MPLPEYVCHKRVRAARVQSIAYGRKFAVLNLDLLDGTFMPWQVDGDWMTKHQPQINGYFVQYLDDDTGEISYQSYSPAKPFEAGYRRAVAVYRKP